MNKKVSVFAGAAVALAAVMAAAVIAVFLLPIKSSADSKPEEMLDYCGAGTLEYFEETEYIDDVSFLLEEKAKNAGGTASGESREFFDKCGGQKWGYFDLAQRSNGKNRQILYDRLFKSMMSVWNNTSDLTNAKMKDDGYNYELSRITFSDIGLTKEEAKETFFAFILDNPVFYFVSKTYSVVDLKYESGKTGTALKVFTYKDFLTAGRRKSCQDAIKKYITDAGSVYKSSDTMANNIRRLHDKIIRDFSYSKISGPVLYGDYYHCAHNIMGGVMYGKGVCETYAKNFQMLCNYYGLDSVYVTGKVSNSGKTENHVWNLLRFDDSYYYCIDVTWDDSNSSSAYYAKGTNSFNKTHKAQSAGSDQDNQFFYALPSNISAADYNAARLKKHNHSMSSWSVYRAASCALDGIEIRTCASCRHYEIKMIPATAHQFKETKVEPTCTAKGYIEHKCTVCGYTYKDNGVAAKGHTFVDTVKAATCTEKGYTEHKCSVCGFVSKDTETPAKGHSFKDVASVPASCTGYGKSEHKCTVCGFVDGSGELPPTGHSFKVRSTVNASCTADGKTTLVCEGCGAAQEKILKAGGHSYESITVAPTATADGYTEHKCTVCGDTYRDMIIPAGGGAYALTSTVEPTCVKDGEKVYTCAENGKSYKQILKAKGHSFRETVHAPTCTEKGYTEYVCLVCGVKYTDSEIPPTGHHYTERVVAPTATAAGYTEHTCTLCGDKWRDNETPKPGSAAVCKVKAVCGNGASINGLKAVIYDGKGTKVCDGVCGSDGTITAGKVLADGSYKISLTMTDYAPRTESFTIKNGASSLGELKLCKYGDTNGDGAIDTADIAMLQQLISKWNVKPVYTETADMNGNGKYDTDELAALQQYVSGWNIKLGK